MDAQQRSEKVGAVAIAMRELRASAQARESRTAGLRLPSHWAAPGGERAVAPASASARFEIALAPGHSTMFETGSGSGRETGRVPELL